jgi:DNA (cytosine-5)-methyltransferase 1
MAGSSKPTLIDLFAGAGGLSEGFKQAGFRVLAGNDFDECAARTYRLSHPQVPFLAGPVEGISVADLLSAAGISPGQLDVLVGGPPCQAFSVYNHQRGMHDKRSGLFREYLRIVEGLRPRLVVMENVTGILSIAGGRAVREIHDSLKLMGYHVEHRTLKAEEFGVPQERRRVFFIGRLERSSIRWPEPTHGTLANDLFSYSGENQLLPLVTIGDAISDLPRLSTSEGEEETAYRCEPQTEYQAMLREGADILANHVAPHLSEINLKRLKHIPQGGSWRDIPFDLLPAGMKKAKRSDHTKRYGRPQLSQLSCTILTKCDLHWGAYIHPTQERTLTVREAARLQSFPDRIRFTGARGDQFRQVGNAVPPLLAKAVARAVAGMLRQSRKREAVLS